MTGTAATAAHNGVDSSSHRTHELSQVSPDPYRPPVENMAALLGKSSHQYWAVQLRTPRLHVDVDTGLPSPSGAQQPASPSSAVDSTDAAVAADVGTAINAPATPRTPNGTLRFGLRTPRQREEVSDDIFVEFPVLRTCGCCTCCHKREVERTQQLERLLQRSQRAAQSAREQRHRVTQRSQRPTTTAAGKSMKLAPGSAAGLQRREAHADRCVLQLAGLLRTVMARANTVATANSNADMGHSTVANAGAAAEPSLYTTASACNSGWTSDDIWISAIEFCLANSSVVGSASSPSSIAAVCANGDVWSQVTALLGMKLISVVSHTG